jgi:hypothetical protein
VILVARRGSLAEVALIESDVKATVASAVDADDRSGRGLPPTFSA